MFQPQTSSQQQSMFGASPLVRTTNSFATQNENDKYSGAALGNVPRHAFLPQFQNPVYNQQAHGNSVYGLATQQIPTTAPQLDQQYFSNVVTTSMNSMQLNDSFSSRRNDPPISSLVHSQYKFAEGNYRVQVPSSNAAENIPISFGNEATASFERLSLNENQHYPTVSIHSEASNVGSFFTLSSANNYLSKASSSSMSFATNMPQAMQTSSAVPMNVPSTTPQTALNCPPISTTYGIATMQNFIPDNKNAYATSAPSANNSYYPMYPPSNHTPYSTHHHQTADHGNIPTMMSAAEAGSGGLSSFSQPFTQNNYNQFPQNSSVFPPQNISVFSSSNTASGFEHFHNAPPYSTSTSAVPYANSASTTHYQTSNTPYPTSASGVLYQTSASATLYPTSTSTAPYQTSASIRPYLDKSRAMEDASFHATAPSNFSQISSTGLMKPSLAPQQKINPEQLPNYVQMVEENQKKHEIYLTSTAGPPPFVTSDVIYRDTGNCSPRYVRATVYGIPFSNDMVKQSQIPIALAVNPFASPAPQEEDIPLTSFVDTPLRCHRCKAYMCPYMQFIDGGKRFHCAFCETNTEVPAEYFSHIDYSGKRVDYLQRPELHLSSYEIVATTDYCKNKTWPKPVAFVFVIDVSYASVRSGLLNLLCDKLKSEILPFLPKDKYQQPSDPSPVKIAFITFNSKLHFYSLKKSLLQPHVMIVSDVSDVFLPLLDGFFIDVQESAVILDSFFSHVKEMYTNTQETEVALGPAIKAAVNALMAADCPGKLFVFATSMPTGNVPGKLSNREDHKLLGTDKEKNVLSPATNFYTKLGEECIAAGCSVDLFLFPNQYMDVSSIGEVCRVSGGQIYFFRYFSADTDGEKLLTDLKHSVSRPTAYDAVMRIRSSNGIRPVDFAGSFRMPNSTDMEFGTIDCDKTIFAEFKHDEKLAPESSVYFQIALLYTSVTGNRVIRIHNMFLPTVNTYSSLFQSCAFETIVSYMMKIGVRSMTVSSYNSIKENIIAQLANILNCYRLNSTGGPTSASHLVLPETLKVLPLFVNSLLKSDVLAGVHTVTVDLKSWLLIEVCSMSVKSIISYLYPKIIPLLEINENEDGSLEYSQIRCMYSALKNDSIYLLENGIIMTIWLGSSLDNSIVQQIFGIPSLSHLHPETMRSLPHLDNPLSRKIRLLINKLNGEKNIIMKSLNKSIHGKSLKYTLSVMDSGLIAANGFSETDVDRTALKTITTNNLELNHLPVVIRQKPSKLTVHEFVPATSCVTHICSRITDHLIIIPLD